MWVYLISPDDSSPDPVDEIRALAEITTRRGGSFLKLSSRNDPPLNGVGAGESVFFCTRTDGDWTVHAEAKLAAEAFRGPTPEAVAPIYGITGDRYWWRGLTDFQLFDPPHSGAELGFDNAFVPRGGRAQVIRVGRVRRPLTEPQSPGNDLLDRLGLGQVDRAEAEIRTVGESSEDIIIDEQGRIFRLNGEQITRPGLEPEKMLKSLADAAAGKWVSLDELRARRS
jgi:hypothetical protein